jgi:hypothetical protein
MRKPGISAEVPGFFVPEEPSQLVYSFRSLRMALLGRTPTIDLTTSPL